MQPSIVAMVKRCVREVGRSVVFFFSSRRRHTRLQGDWSSDVCSSDLPRFNRQTTYRSGMYGPSALSDRYVVCLLKRGYKWPENSGNSPESAPTDHKIGRASCRERV